MNKHPNLNNLKPYRSGEQRAIINGRKGGIKKKYTFKNKEYWTKKRKMYHG